MALRSHVKYNKLEKDSKRSGEFSLELTFEYSTLKNAIHEMPYGGKRRKIIHEMLKEGVEFKVNGMHEIQTKNDPDIKRLLKDGKIEMFTTTGGSWGRKSKATYLRIKNG